MTSGACELAARDMHMFYRSNSCVPEVQVMSVTSRSGEEKDLAMALLHADSSNQQQPACDTSCSTHTHSPHPQTILSSLVNMTGCTGQLASLAEIMAATLLTIISFLKESLRFELCSLNSGLSRVSGIEWQQSL